MLRRRTRARVHLAFKTPITGTRKPGLITCIAGANPGPFSFFMIIKKQTRTNGLAVRRFFLSDQREREESQKFSAHPDRHSPPQPWVAEPIPLFLSVYGFNSSFCFSFFLFLVSFWSLWSLGSLFSKAKSTGYTWSLSTSAALVFEEIATVVDKFEDFFFWISLFSFF
jgi:hypothetical protein